jgi:predicted RNA binding protein YcfA (HicA-like mRNA interferase family)
MMKVERNSSALIRMLKEAGWKLRSSHGSHHVFVHAGRGGIVVIPHPKKELPTGTARAIMKQAGLTGGDTK